jgi:hypothetical protein
VNPVFVVEPEAPSDIESMLADSHQPSHHHDHEIVVEEELPFKKFEDYQPQSQIFESPEIQHKSDE